MPLYPKQEPPYYEEADNVDPIKQYIAIASQLGTANPTMIILKNTIGDITWTRTGPGNYTGELTGAFPANKTLLLVGQGNFLENGINYLDMLTAPNQINLQTCVNSFNTPGDDKLDQTTIQITVYP